MNTAVSMNGVMTSLVCFITLLTTFTQCQMIFPDRRSEQSNFVDGYSEDNYPIDTSFSNGLLSNFMQSEAGGGKLAHGINNFALNINKALLSEAINSYDNIVLSPLSITGALALLLLGSVGQTYNEIAQTLGFFDDITNSKNVHQEFGMFIEKLTKGGQFHDYLNPYKPNITYASAVFLQQDFPIRQQYEDFIRSVYKSIIRHVDYRGRPQDAKNLINNWVSEMTNGKIKDILPSEPQPYTRLILANALYFKAEWEKYFMGELTSRQTFFLDKRNPRQTVKVDMMANFGMFPYYKNNELMAVGLPYKGNSTFFFAIKPVDSTKKDIRQIVKELTADSLDSLIRNMTYHPSTIVSLPKMKLTSNYNLRSSLEALGIHAIFSSTKSNLALLSPVETKAPFASQNNNEQNIRNDEFIFTRFGDIDDEKSANLNCTMLFENKTPDGTTCTMTEKIHDRNVTVVYKQIGDKIGRRILNGIPSRKKRQAGFEEWNPGLYVDDVLHKVDIDITESGTEAAAASAVLISRGGIRPVFAANEPFFFMIRDEETKIILFSSIVFKPLPNYQ